MLMDPSLAQQSFPLIAGAFALVIVLYCLSFTSKTRKSRGAPEASGAWPVLGHFKLLGGSSVLPHIALASMADKHGPVFTVRLGVRQALVVNNWETVKEIFTNHDVIVSTRPKHLAAKILGYDYAMFGFSPYGTYWREMRKITSLELLSRHQIDLLKHVRDSEIEASIKEIYKLWTEKHDEGGKVLVEMKKWFGELNLNVVLRMVAGKRYSGALSPEDDEEMKRCRKVMREWFHLLGLFVVADTLPFLGWLDLGGYEKAMKKVSKEMDGIVAKWLEEHRKNRDSGEVYSDKDFMDVIMSTVETADLDNDDDTITKATCMVIIASSTDTTTVMLTWALSLLLNNRHALRKAQEELDKHIGKGRQVSESDINNLVYLQAIVKETLRLYPAGPLGGLREFTEDCIVANYHVPKGTMLMVNLWKLHRNPQIWSNPSEFMPERFLSGNLKDIDVKGTDFRLIPFGTGRRLCPGIALGLQMLHIVLATFLQNFEISTPNDAPVDMNESAGLTNVKATPLEVLIAPRLPSTIIS